MADRHKFQPYGVFGGQPGTLAETNLFRENEKISLASKGVVELRKGDILSFLLSGAGGYGSAALREKEAIEKDIEDGYVTLQGAKKDYNWPP